MSFDRVIGQITVRARLMDALMSGRLAHALLLHGPQGTGAEALAIELAKAVNCRSGPGEPCQKCRACRAISLLQYPDVHIAIPASTSKASASAIRPDDADTEAGGRRDTRAERRFAFTAQLAENPYAPLLFGKNDYLSIDDIRELRREASVKPFEGRRKVMILFAADRMNIPASNALLKTLEEPPGNLLLILTTQRIHQLLPTIVSRCQPVHLSRLTDETIQEALLHHFEMDATRAQIAVRYADGSLGQALMAVSETGEQQRTLALNFLEALYEGTLFDVFEAIEYLTGQQKDAPAMEGVFEMLMRVYRDIFLIASAGDKTSFSPDDYPAWFADLSLRYTEEQSVAAMTAIEETRKSLARNAHLQLALTVLALRLRGMMNFNKRGASHEPLSN